jgi:hypothetical protein
MTTTTHPKITTKSPPKADNFLKVGCVIFIVCALFTLSSSFVPYFPGLVDAFDY